jgi:hypothetical protein
MYIYICIYTNIYIYVYIFTYINKYTNVDGDTKILPLSSHDEDLGSLRKRLLNIKIEWITVNDLVIFSDVDMYSCRHMYIGLSTSIHLFTTNRILQHSYLNLHFYSPMVFIGSALSCCACLGCSYSQSEFNF